MGLLLLLFAATMAIATFVENDYGTETSKALIYGAKWFEVLLLLLAFNFIGNIPKYNLFSWGKAPVFVFHIAFVIIILGAGITKYRGFEGLMTIKENESSNRIMSVDSYLQVQIGNQKIVKNFASKQLLMSELGFNSIDETYVFEDKEVQIKLKKYVPRAAFVLEDEAAGSDYIHVVVASQEQRKDFYIQKGTRKRIYETTVAFDTEERLQNEIYLKTHGDEILASFPEDTGYFVMAQNISGLYPKDSLVPLQFRALSKINETPMVFNTVETNKKESLIELPRDPNVKNPESAIVLELASGNETEELIIFGGRGYVNPKSTMFLNGLHIQVRYGSKPIPLNFKLHLNDFELERYPGSESPSAFYSNIKVIDENRTFDYLIFMNNVLSYKGYRFFQSAYLPDERGTILSVNYDYWGTLVTYIGYSLLTLGMLLSLIWNTSFFNRITKKIVA